jgi:hypothetical protein
MYNCDREVRRLRAEIKKLGKERLIRTAVERGDPASLCGLMEVLQFTSPEAVDLITAFAMLRYCGAGAAAVDAWKPRAAAQAAAL